ncbi:hypothetical protein KTQ42_08665|uniref:hypothetical protein n=1 Tax=Noviherbaspirillum sp. L7-7A TaxID=2850560 RepID=UPI001C2BC6AC|nr:hypothetical protein [Noviherbaspirillum sp. L7-7A]MBV0879374.1 hypothetical protein [Noviherbaspirillum sp. L7-7A]
MNRIHDFSHTGGLHSGQAPRSSPEKDADAQIHATLKPYQENASTPAFNDVKQALLWAWDAGSRQDANSVKALARAGNQLITALQSAHADYLSRHGTRTEAGTIFREVAKKQLARLLPEAAEKAYNDLVGANDPGSREEREARIVSGLQRLAEKGVQGSTQSAMSSSATLDTRAVAKVDAASNASRAKSADASDIADMTNDADATNLKSQVAEALEPIAKDTQSVIAGLYYMWRGNVNEGAQNTFKAIEQGKQKYVNAMKGVIADRGDQSARQFNTETRRQLAEKLPAELRSKYLRAFAESEAALKKNRMDYAEFRRCMLSVVLKLSPEGVTCAVRAARGNTEKSGNSGVGRLWSKAVQMFDALTITESERMIKAVNVLIDKLLIQHVEWQAHPKVAELRQSMEAYITSCNAFYGERQRLLLEKYPELIINAAMSVNCISSLPEQEAIAIATQRELFNVKMRSPPLHVNKAALGCETSAIRSMKEASKPGNQLSIVMSTPIITDDNRVVTAMVISVPAPALDMDTQPEWSHYAENGKLKESEYKTAMGTLRSHVFMAAGMDEFDTLALSAYGLNNFLNGFRDDRTQKEICIRIGQGELSKLIAKLQEKDCDVRYMEREAGKNPLWNSLSQKHNKLTYAGTISGDWIPSHEKIMIVNAGDGHALIGNACNKDDSIDGYLGRASGAHIAHALFVNLIRFGFEDPSKHLMRCESV